MYSPRLLPGMQAVSSELGGGMTARPGKALSLLPVVSRAPPAGSLPLRVPSRAAATVLTILPASAGQLRGQGAGGVNAFPSAGASPRGAEQGAPTSCKADSSSGRAGQMRGPWRSRLGAGALRGFTICPQFPVGLHPGFHSHRS